MSKEMLGNERHWKPHVRICFCFYTVCVILLIAAVLCLALPDLVNVCQNQLDKRIPSCVKTPLMAWTKHVITYLKMVGDKNGVKAVISAIGIYAVAFAWLVGIQQQKIYGVAIGTLLRWAYPGFYRFYFLIFLGTDFVGLYASSIPGQRWATGYATIGIMLGVIYSVWVCYRFVLDFHARRRIAEAYHYAQINAGITQHNKHKYTPMWLSILWAGIVLNIHPDECRACQLQNIKLKRKIEESINLLGRLLAEQEENGEWIHINAIFDLWNTAYLRYKSLITEGNSQPENLNELCYLAEELWCHALSKKLPQEEQVQLAGIIIEKCQIEISPKTEESIICLMAGLLLSLSNDEEGMEYGRFKTLLPKLTWVGMHCIRENSLPPPFFYLYEALILGYLWMTLMIQGRISPSFRIYLKGSESIRIENNF